MIKTLSALVIAGLALGATSARAQSAPAPAPAADQPLAVRAGASSGPAQLTLFCDLEEEACANLVVVLSRIAEAFPEQAGITFRHKAAADHEGSPLGYRAALAAARQGKGWELLDMACANSDRLTADGVRSMAAQLRLDLSRFLPDLEAADAARVLEDDAREADSLQVSAVPALFLNGERLADVRTFDRIEAAIKAAIK